MTDERPIRRLGRRQLGRHAYEKHMPKRVHAIAAAETSNNTLSGVIPVLARLLDQDATIERAYLCKDFVDHIFKAQGEGDHFCGYRNIQMLLRAHDNGRRDSILKVQAMIETAWDMGINASGRTETGGIVDTRKHIGTAEAQALFQSLDVPCTANAFSNVQKSKTAYQDLLDHVEEYFSVGTVTSRQSTKVIRTSLSPIYLQRPRHSLTIVGIERRCDGSRCLLVFDPAYEPPKDLKRAVSAGTAIKDQKSVKSVLKTYLRDERYLKRYRAFETLHIDSKPPP